MTSPAKRLAFTVRGLRKSFADKFVLASMDLDIAAGTTFALLGARSRYNRGDRR